MNASGGLLSQNRYLPFGEVRDNISGGPIPESVTDFGYTGQRNIASMGLMDYDARFYSPTLMRFTQPDTLVPSPGNLQAWNRYSYVLNNPLLYIDPTGHEACLDGICGLNPLEEYYQKVVSQESQYLLDGVKPGNRGSKGNTFHVTIIFSDGVPEEIQDRIRQAMEEIVEAGSSEFNERFIDERTLEVETNWRTTSVLGISYNCGYYDFGPISVSTSTSCEGTEYHEIAHWISQPLGTGELTELHEEWMEFVGASLVDNNYNTGQEHSPTIYRGADLPQTLKRIGQNLLKSIFIPMGM